MELASMLPGFRFLFTAIVLSMSVLIFGLGAAALLRAKHEEFVNLPSRRATPEPMFARLNDDPAHAGAEARAGRPPHLQRLLVLGAPVGAGTLAGLA